MLLYVLRFKTKCSRKETVTVPAQSQGYFVFMEIEKSIDPPEIATLGNHQAATSPHFRQIIPIELIELTAFWLVARLSRILSYVTCAGITVKIRSPAWHIEKAIQARTFLILITRYYSISGSKIINR